MDLETVIINGSFYKKVLKFYYKFNSNDLSISFDKKEGYSIHRVFKNKSQEIPYFLYPMYTASVKGKETCSVDLFSRNNDVWYNSGFREVRY